MSTRGFQSDIVENWAQGVVTAMLADRLPDGAISAGKNTMFYYIGPQQSVIGTRKGCTLQNETALDAAVNSQAFLDAPGASYHLLQLANGDLGVMDAGTFSLIGSGGEFSAPTDKASWATFENFAYVANGTDLFKTDGTDISNFGIAQPGTGDWTAVAASGGSNLPAGDYTLVIQYFNSSTGRGGPESESKAVTITGGQRIKVTLPSTTTIADSQVDYIKIYIQQDGIRNDFFLVVAGTSPAITGTSGWAPTGSTTDVYVDCTQAQIDVFVTLSPGVNNNYPPPAGAKYLVTNHQRMFASDGTDLYWSDVGNPEAWNTVDNRLPVGEDGDYVTGLAALGDAVIVFKLKAVYALQGVSPESWQLNLVDNTVGCTSHSSIGNYDNRLWWMSLVGPCMWSSLGNNIQNIAAQLVDDLFAPDAVTSDALTDAVIIGSPNDQYVAWAITPVEDSVNTRIIPFHFGLNRWMASEWTMVDVQSCVVTHNHDEGGLSYPMIADYDGFVYQVGTSSTDGLLDGETQTGTVTSATATTLVCSTAGWTPSGLIGRYVMAWTGDDLTNVQRRKITANTATTLTVATWDATPASGDNFIIAGILMDWHGPFRNGSGDGSGAFYRKRLELMFTEMFASTGGEEVQVSVYTDMNTAEPIRTRAFTIGTGSLWDVATWDVDEWSGRAELRMRFPIRTQAYSWQLRVQHMSTGNQIYVGRSAMQWLTKTRKVGRR